MIYDVPTFKFWCNKVLPLVYDNSLSYYEVLCKVVKYINDMIEADKIMARELEDLRRDLNIVQEWIDNFDTSGIEHIIEEHIATMIFLEINDAGYIVYNMPEAWKDIEFNTTGKDISIPDVEYGHLVLSY